jgi:hypothetical protein
MNTLKQRDDTGKFSFFGKEERQVTINYLLKKTISYAILLVV